MCVLSKKNREKERGKCLICIKICICNSRVKFSICGFRNWWEQATRCTVSSSLSLFLYLCTWTVYLHVCAIWNMQFIVHGQAQILCWQVYVWANVKFSLSEQCTENLVFQFLSVTYFLKFCLCWLLYLDSHI